MATSYLLSIINIVNRPTYFKDFNNFIIHFMLTTICIEICSDLSAIYEPEDY
jgi:hypothetical protein